MSRSVQDVSAHARTQRDPHPRHRRRQFDRAAWKHPIEFNGQQVVGTVGFIGEISGLIYLYLSAEFAKIVATACSASRWKKSTPAATNPSTTRSANSPT